MGVDIVGVSFVQTPDDMRRVRAAAVAAGAPDLALVAKIEKPLAVDRIGEIADQSDGLMVARGDLGIEMPLEVIPAVQKRVIIAARERGGSGHRRDTGARVHANVTEADARRGHRRRARRGRGRRRRDARR